MTIQAPDEQEQDRLHPRTDHPSAPVQAAAAPIAQAIRETKLSLYARFPRYEELNRELQIIVMAAVENEIVRKKIGWYSKERIREVIEFIMRTAKQRGWEEEQIKKAAEEILGALESSGVLRTSDKSNHVSRLLEGAVLHI